MARKLSVLSAIDKSAIGSTVAWVVLLEIRIKQPNDDTVYEILRVARNSENLTYNGYLWSAYPFEISIDQEAGAQPTVNLVVQDQTRAIQARLQTYKGIIGSEVTVYVVNSSNLTQPPEVTEYFLVTGASARDYAITFILGAENALNVPFPRRRQTRDRCQWRYKGTECGYSGPLTSCDQSLDGNNGCLVHANTINFGGFPGINPSSAQAY